MAQYAIEKTTPAILFDKLKLIPVQMLSSKIQQVKTPIRRKINGPDDELFIFIHAF
jgi:hypothetical protein